MAVSHPHLAGVDLRSLGYACVETAATEKATHVVLRRREGSDGVNR